ncbi:MAG: hypothetical protein H6Q17_966 [Bacteroidetes bacterium]|nr:hypothetical protein [Bacteroidota bacterium]
MKRFIIATVAIYFSAIIFAQTNVDAINGIWQNDKKNIKIEFFKTTIGHSAKITWMEQANDENGKPKLDTKNPNPALRKNPLVGTVIIYNLKYDRKKTYSSGKIYAPKRGITANCMVTMISNNEISISAKKGIFSETKNWTRCK